MKDVRIVVHGVQDGIPGDRIAFIVLQALKGRVSDVSVDAAVSNSKHPEKPAEAAKASTATNPKKGKGQSNA